MNDNDRQFARAPSESEADQQEMETATFAAGCFWGIEEAFQRTDGVKDAVSGYTGGHVERPTYEQVCSGRTGHAEAVRVVYDPQEVTYEQLLEVFWKIHDPTQVNRQGPDVGSQYRSAIFYHSDAQREAAERSKRQLEESGKYSRPIATQIEAAEEFYPAEEYHQNYARKHPGACHIPIE